MVDTEADGFSETAWQARTLSIGTAKLTVTFTVPKCVMSTLQQGDLPADREILRTMSEHNSVGCFSPGTAYPCVGVYADVVVGGRSSPDSRSCSSEPRGRFHVDPGVLVEAIFVEVIPLLNELMDLTPVESLPDANVTAADLGPPAERDSPFNEASRFGSA